MQVQQLWLAFPRVRGYVGSQAVYQAFCGLREVRGCKIKSSESFAAWAAMSKDEFVEYCATVFEIIDRKVIRLVQRSISNLRIWYLWELEDQGRFFDLDKHQSNALEELFEIGCSSASWGKFTVNFATLQLESEEQSPVNLRRRCCVSQRSKSESDFSFQISPLVSDASWSVARCGQRGPLPAGHSFILETAFRRWLTSDNRSESICFDLCGEVAVAETCSTSAWTLVISEVRHRLGRRIVSSESQSTDPLASAIPLLTVEDDLRACLNQYATTGRIVLEESCALSTVRKLIDDFSVSPLTFAVTSRPQPFGKPFTICVEEEWVPLCPLNEWLLLHDAGLLFMFGEWLSVLNRCAAAYNGVYLWIDDGRPSVRLLCRKVPVCVPTALLGPKCPNWIRKVEGVITTESFEARDVLNAFFGTTVSGEVASFFSMPNSDALSHARSLGEAQFTLHGSIASALAGDPAKFILEVPHTRQLQREVKYGFNFPVAM